jgi:alpha-L-arabinofuranosidase
MKKHFLVLAVLAGSYLHGQAQQKVTRISVDVSKPGIEVPEGLWGVFYEEINRAGDGGLVPEMVYNMGFEEKNIPDGVKFENGNLIPPAKPMYNNGRVRNFTLPFNADKKSEGWTLEPQGSSKATMEVVDVKPLHPANPHSLSLQIAENNGGVKLVNDGFVGISLVKGETYNFFFHVRAEKSYKGKVIASLVDASGKVLTSNEFKIKNSGKWIKYSAVITAPVTDNQAKLSLDFTSAGNLWLDYVSLMPQKTFMDHGLRQDLAQTLAELKPKFIRWPGGCIVEGFTMSNRVNWKESIGERIGRKGQFDLWGYHNTYNFGYHEFLQFCEDIGASGMFVCNAGLACSYRNGDYYELDEMGPIIQDALDAIEYAIGDVKTKWGALRAKNGHPAPFPLKYVEIGNENDGEKYGERYNMMYKALKAKYPQISYINTHGGIGPNLPNYFEAGSVEMVDPHYYNDPTFFFSNTQLYDKVPRGKFDIYIGEYACNSNVGRGMMIGALSEAAFMTGIERNSDVVKMASFAPLLENVNYRHWSTNLIRFKNDAVLGRSSYYVQKMFNENRPNRILSTAFDYVAPDNRLNGYIGIDAVSIGANSSVSFKDITVKDGNLLLYKSDFPEDVIRWNAGADWNQVDNAYVTKTLDLKGQDAQNRIRSGNPLILKEKRFEDCAVSIQVKREAQFSGFSIRFAMNDAMNYLMLTIAPQTRGFGGNQAGQPGACSAIVSQVTDGISRVIGNVSRSFTFEAGSWHDVQLSVNGKMIGCTVDGKKLGEVEYKPLQKQYAIAGYDKATKEVIVKIVNGESTPFRTTIQLDNVKTVDPKGSVITLSSARLDDENSFEEPMKISPKTTTFDGFKSSFDMTFKPYSFTILRIKAE